MNEEVKNENRFIRLQDVLLMTSIPKSTLMAMITDGDFPAPVKLGARSRAWVELEVEKWIQEKIDARDTKRQKRS